MTAKKIHILLRRFNDLFEIEDGEELISKKIPPIIQDKRPCKEEKEPMTEKTIEGIIKIGFTDRDFCKKNIDPEIQKITI